jgi:signal transduction histidine kinase/CheY-like chemotaxis protein
LQAEAIGMEMADLIIPPDLQDKHHSGIADYLSTGEGPVLNRRLEMRARRKDGSQILVELAVTRPTGSDRPLFTGFVRDISQEREAEKRTYGLMTELREADQRKDEFLATLAHELRGPLAPLCNMLEILKRVDGNDDLLEHSRAAMERQLSQLVRLVDDLLDMSRITRNKLDLRKQRVELSSVIHQAMETTRPLAESAGHKVAVTIPPEPIYLHADPVRLAQVFGNLLNNSCKYTEPGGHIWLTAQRQGSDAVVWVKDNGVGIPSDKLAGIFDMFTQVDRSLERSQGGLGIGLSLVKRLVEMHDGTVEALSEGEERGSEFVVRLPVMLGTPQSQAPAEPSTSDEAAVARRILVVDDNRDSATSLAMLLKLAGNETHTAHDGLEAVEAAKRLRPDVVLLDIGLPKLNGFEACRRIRAESWGQNMMLLALTGWGQDDDRRKAKEAGFDEHLVKPVDYALLMKLLEQSNVAQV